MDLVRFLLLIFAIIMILIVVWNYIVVDNWSNLTTEPVSKEISDIRRYYSNAIESYLTIVAILVGIQIPQRS